MIRTIGNISSKKKREKEAEDRYHKKFSALLGMLLVVLVGITIKRMGM